MKALLQRVAHAHVDVDGEVVGRIGTGWLVLVCAEPDDDEATADRLLAKILRLRCFPDEAGRMNRDVRDVGGGLLIVSQFTLAADTRSGNRPGFSGAAPPALARRLYDHLVHQARCAHPDVAAGVFGADMKVHLLNDGPVTIPLDLAPVRAARPDAGQG